MEINYKDICMLIVNGLSNHKVDMILKNSLYYYCCGKDPTPIIAFKSNYPLYVYADIIDYGIGDFQEETNELYHRLSSHSLKRVDTHKLISHTFKNAELTIWRPIRGKEFGLLYVQGDAKKVFTSIYDNNGKLNLPKCVCNYLYEIIGDSGNTRDYLFEIEQKVEYVLGYHYSRSYRKIRSYTYFGGPGSKHKNKIDLYQKIDLFRTKGENGND